jgi:hypothetical protein
MLAFCAWGPTAHARMTLSLRRGRPKLERRRDRAGYIRLIFLLFSFAFSRHVSVTPRHRPKWVRASPPLPVHPVRPVRPVRPRPLQTTLRTKLKIHDRVRSEKDQSKTLHCRNVRVSDSSSLSEKSSSASSSSALLYGGGTAWCRGWTNPALEDARVGLYHTSESEVPG